MATKRTKCANCDRYHAWARLYPGAKACDCKCHKAKG
jgi:hypothetical protein